MNGLMGVWEKTGFVPLNSYTHSPIHPFTKTMNNLIHRLPGLSFKARIILTFTILTAGLVLILSRISYVSVKNIYLNQLSDQTRLLTRLSASGLNTRYLTFLDAQTPESLASRYYGDNMRTQAENMRLPNIFIFDHEFRVLVQAAAGETGRRDARLLLSRTEIEALESGQSATSLPFKGDDGQWYLWGFYRLDRDHWLGVQENASRLEKVEGLSRVFWGIGAAGVLLTILSGGLLARALTRPIDRLVRFSELIGSGKFDTPLPRAVRGELAILAAALDKMRRDLAQHHQEKETMLAQIAHEIRNPLGGIELLAGLMREDLQRQAADTGYADKMLQEIAGLKSLITAYLSYSRPLKAHPEQVDLAALIEEVRAVAHQGLAEKAVTLRADIDGAPDVWFDRSHLRQILLNLLGNSVEALGNNGRVTIRARRNGRGTVIAVHDDGPGIPEAHLESVFEPFFTTRSDGTGLGLAVCRKLCRENRAEIRAFNHPEGGCAVEILAAVAEDGGKDEG